MKKPLTLSTYVVQENQPVGTSILQLTVSDRDASHNGPPFTFSIISGNEGEAFQITPQGVLVSAATLSRQTQEFYLLQAQVRPQSLPLILQLSPKLQEPCSIFTGGMKGQMICRAEVKRCLFSIPHMGLACAVEYEGAAMKT